MTSDPRTYGERLQSDSERLDSDPAAVFCADCAQEREQGRGQR